MSKRILFVDYENVGSVDLKDIAADVQVPFFFGASQKSVPTEFMRAALNLRERFVPIDIEGQGTNALDFHIAYYLGESLSVDPQADCVILSKDKGFDPLVKHLVGRGFRVRRVSALSQAFPAVNTASRAPASTDADGTPLASALRLLAGMQPRARPRKRKSLTAHLRSHFRSTLSDTQLAALIDQLVSDKKLSDVEGALTYHL